MTDIFLSYSREDQVTARRYADAFEREGLTVWWDQTLKAGEAYDRVTEKALQDAKAVVVLWSKHSVESHWVRSEATQAQTNGTLVPVMIESCKRPIMFELMHTAELAHWKGDAGDPAWKSFLGDVREFVKKEGAPPLPGVIPTIASSPRQFGVRTLIGLVALLVVGAGVLWFATRAPKDAAKTVDAVAAAPSGVTKEVTLAVLPFADFSTTHDQESFCDGLSEEILNQLAQVKGLAVTGRTSSFSFKGKNEDMRVIAQKLGVANLLEGSIQKEGNQLRITAQLINGKTGTHLWSKTYPREYKDIFAVQDEIARDVGQALSVKLDVGDMPRAQGGTTDLDAYENYLRGLAAFGQADMTQTLQHLHEAVTFDPKFVSAWWALFATANILANREEKARAMQELEALAPGSWQTLAAQGLQLNSSRQWSIAETTFEAAKTSAPPNFAAMVDSFHSVNLRQLGRVREAHEMWQPVVKADPLSFVLSDFQQFDLLAMGRNADALAELERSKSLIGYQGGGERELTAVLLLHNKADTAAVWSQYSALMKQDPFLQKLFTLRSDVSAVRAVLHHAFDDPTLMQAERPIRIAFWADYFGDKDLVLAALRKELVDGKDGSVHVLWTPWRTDVRSDPRFKDIVKELGLVDYWRSSGNWGDFCKPVGKDDFECH